MNQYPQTLMNGVYPSDSENWLSLIHIFSKHLGGGIYLRMDERCFRVGLML